MTRVRNMYIKSVCVFVWRAPVWVPIITAEYWPVFEEQQMTR